MPFVGTAGQTKDSRQGSCQKDSLHLAEIPIHHCSKMHVYDRIHEFCIPYYIRL